MDLSLNQQLNNLLSEIDVRNKPNLFLHVCCGPCSTAVLYKLIQYFNIYIIFYNSNIDCENEFKLRYEQLEKVINFNNYNVKVLYNDYIHSEFLDSVKGFENEPEGGLRCEKCFKLRLTKTLDIALKYILNNNLSFNKNYLCTTLSISPHKNAELIEKIGEELCDGNDLISYLPSDFKKENGYLNSIKLSKQYGLYRQEYCGCEFAK